MKPKVTYEKLAYDPNGIPTYTVRFEKFRQKMQNWECGKSLESPTFTLSNGVDLCLQIFPNGVEGKSGKISCFLVNKSKYNILVRADFRLCNKQGRFGGVSQIKAGRELGFPGFAKHAGIGGAIYIKEEFLKFECILWKVEPIIKNEPLPERSIEARFEAQIKELEDKIANMTVGNSNIAKPQCPICMEDMTSSTRIAQCVNGHLVCLPCKKKMGARECVCGKPVSGRAFGMETYLKTIFGSLDN